MADLDRSAVGDPVPLDLVVVRALLDKDPMLVAGEHVLLEPIVAGVEDWHRVPLCALNRVVVDAAVGRAEYEDPAHAIVDGGGVFDAAPRRGGEGHAERGVV